MNYLEIVLEGFCNRSNRRNLENYFIREYKKAEKENYELFDFQSGCRDAISVMKRDIGWQTIKRQKQLHTYLEFAKEGRLKFKDTEEKTIDQKRQVVIDYCKQAINDAGPDRIGDQIFDCDTSKLTNGKYDKKISYDDLTEIEESIKNFGRKIKLERRQKEESELQPEIFLDFSNNKESEKIVFLHELGILDYLMQKEPFNTSTNKLAEIVSAFTGIPQKTAQSYLNPIYSKTAAQKNNPLTTNNIKKVSEKLLKIGYKK